MPVAAVIEESILVTHSGIPKMKGDKKLIEAFEGTNGSPKYAELSDPKEMMPIAYEVTLADNVYVE